VTIIVWLAVGAAIGVASVVALRLHGLGARLLNVAGGIVGAIGGGLAEGRGAIGADPWEMNSLLVAAAGALILIGIVNLFRHRPVH
jgi:uncharacterized membrane protein YeaQ/YmgE (transglycosylase-associated protein family)